MQIQCIDKSEITTKYFNNKEFKLNYIPNLEI